MNVKKIAPFASVLYQKANLKKEDKYGTTKLKLIPEENEVTFESEEELPIQLKYTTSTPICITNKMNILSKDFIEIQLSTPRSFSYPGKSSIYEFASLMENEEESKHFLKSSSQTLQYLKNNKFEDKSIIKKFATDALYDAQKGIKKLEILISLYGQDDDTKIITNQLNSNIKQAEKYLINNN